MKRQTQTTLRLTPEERYGEHYISKPEIEIQPGPYSLTTEVWIDDALGRYLARLWRANPCAAPSHICALVVFHDASDQVMAPPIEWQFPVTQNVVERGRWYYSVLLGLDLIDDEADPGTGHQQDTK